MVCPQCATPQPEDVKFCKSCGANLFAVRKVIASRNTDEKFDWSKTWVAEMLLSEQECTKRDQAHKLERGETTEFKRYSEIKAGIITSSVGVGVMIFLYALFQAIIASGKISTGVAPILRVIWVVGVIPFLIGVGLAFNGLVLTKKQAEIASRALQSGLVPQPLALAAKDSDPSPSSAAWPEPPEFGVTENLTKELR